MFMATFSGLVCFSVLGNMAYTYGIDFTEVINAGNNCNLLFIYTKGHECM